MITFGQTPDHRKGTLHLKFEKRSSGGEQPVQPQQEAAQGGRKPVVVYIMILFIVAFLLMAISLIMHQRSNSEAVGALQNSVSALQEIQAAQDQNLHLQEALNEAEAQVQDLQKQLEEAQAAQDSADRSRAALESLYTLQQQYAAKDYEACKATVAAMEEAGDPALLPAESAADGVIAPAQRYQQFKEALTSK